MAALLVGMSVAAVLMTAVMPAWKQVTRREKEAELIFRGEQYARAIGLFQRRAGPGVLPPNVDVLVSQRFLRKKFKDPMTLEDFDILTPAQSGAAPGASGGPGGRGNAGPASASTPQGSLIAPQVPGGRGVGGVIGVVSKSKQESLRVYNGRTRYNEWQFVYTQQVQAPAAGGPGRGAQPQRGAPPPFGGRPPGFGTPPAGRQGVPARGGPPPFAPGGRGGVPPAAPPR